MAYDGLVNFSIVNELKNKIIDGKVDKIFEPNFEEILLGIYSNGVKYALDLVINSKYYRANLTTNTKPNPTFAPNFCMTLRKHLLGTHITNIYTDGLERIIFIEFEGYNKSKDFSTKKLVIELMGKHSNIILIDNGNKIIDALKHFSTSSGSYRDIYAGAIYKLPKSDKLDFFDIKDASEFYKVLINNSVLTNSNSLALVVSSTFTGISKNSVFSFEKSLNISDSITSEASASLFDYLKNIISSNQNVMCKNHEKDYALEFCNSEKENSLQINFFLDDFYTAKETNNTFIVYRDNLLKLISNKLSKLSVKLDSINDKLQECKNAEKYKLYGELITSNLYKINDLNTDTITLENYYDNNTPIVIPLDKSVSPSTNAKNFFKKYKKLKSAKEYVDIQKKSVINEIAYLESIIYEIGIAKNINDIDEIYSEIQNTNVALNNKKNKVRKKAFSKGNKKIAFEPLKFNIDGFTVLVGKNNNQNDYLTTKVANPDDIWFHVKDFHGSHVILRAENKIPAQETLNKCASLAKEHSKAADSSNVTVDYTYAKYVKKPSGSKPGMVIYTNNKSVTVK